MTSRESTKAMLSVEDYEDYAARHMNKAVYAFYSMGAEKETTVKDNKEAFKRYRFIPRMLRGSTSGDLSVSVLGEKVSTPIGFSPTAYQRLVHPDGEVAVAKAAASMNAVYTMSTLSTTSVEDIQKAAPTGIHWMQVYIVEDRKVTERMIQRAEKSGFKALVMTVDTPRTGLHLRVERTKFMIPPHLSTPNIPEVMAKARNASEEVAVGNLSGNFCHDLTWNDVTWLRSVTKLPVVLKGILTAEDARKAVEYGAAAVWVSNHGGRQLDGTFATIDALEGIVEALEGTECEVYVDGGVRWGSDVLKALALGARAVFVGRPLAWGLAYDGENGVRQVLEMLKFQLDRSMLLAGCRNLDEVGPHILEKMCCCSSKM